MDNEIGSALQITPHYSPYHSLQQTLESHASIHPDQAAYLRQSIHLPPPHQPLPLSPQVLQQPLHQRAHRNLVRFGLPPIAHEASAPLPYDIAAQDQRATQALVAAPLEQYQAHNSAAIPPLTTSRRDELKRPRACEACRSLKVRCDPAPGQSSCRRCARASRSCIVTMPSRKRQRKTDGRVAELEKKIDALTASLQATQERVRSASGEDDDDEEDEEEDLHGGPDSTKHGESSPSRQSSRAQLQPIDEVVETLVSTGITNGKKRRHSALQDDLSDAGPPPVRVKPRRLSDYSIHRLLSPPELPAANPSLPSHEYADVVDRKILDASTAARFFDHFKDKMLHHACVLTFPPGILAASIRRTKPRLFLAILAVASGYFDPSLQKILLREVNRMYAEAIICRDETSHELVQAMQISALWHAAEEYNGASPYQMAHIAAVTAMSLGLGHKPPRRRLIGQDRAKMSALLSRKAIIDPTSIQAMQTWMVCYLLCGSGGMAYRRPNIIPWNTFLEECVETMMKLEDDSNLAKSLAIQVKLKRIADDIAIFLSTVDAAPWDRFGGLQQLGDIKKLQARLDAWEAESSACGTGTPLLRLSYLTAKAIVNGSGFLAEHVAEDVLEAPNTSRSKSRATSHHVDLLRLSVASIHAVLDAFLALSADDLRMAPPFHLFSVTQIVISLLACHYNASKPNSDLAQVVTPLEMQTDSYLNRIIDLLHAAAMDGQFHPAQRVYMAIKMLKTRYERHRECLDPRRTHEPLDVHLKFQVQPVDTERTSPRQGYRKLSVPADPPTSHYPPKDRTLPVPSHSPTLHDSAAHTLLTTTNASTIHHPPQNFWPIATHPTCVPHPDSIHHHHQHQDHVQIMPPLPPYGTISSYLSPTSYTDTSAAAMYSDGMLEAPLEQVLGLVFPDGNELSSLFLDGAFYQVMSPGADNGHGILHEIMPGGENWEANHGAH